MFLRQLQRIDTRLDELAIAARAGRKPSLWMSDSQRTELASRVHSVAMRQQFGNPEDSDTKRLATLTAQLRSAAKSDDWKTFQSLAVSIASSDQKFEELRWAFRISSLDDQINTDLKLRSFEISALSTEVVASAWQAFPWVEEELHSAERLRLSAERILIDGLISGSETELGNLFDRAASEFVRIQSKVTKLNRAASNLELATVRLPAYIEWARLVSLESRGPTPSLAELLRMAKLCEQLRGYLQNQDAAEFTQLAKVAEDLERLNKSFTLRTRSETLTEFISKPHLPGEPKQWESLLQTPLVRAKERAVLWSLLEDRVFDFASVSRPSLKTELGLKPRAFTITEQRELDAHLELQLQLLQIPGELRDPSPTTTEKTQPADSFTKQATLDSQQSWFLSIRSHAEQLERSWRTIASALRTELPSRSEALTIDDSVAKLLAWEMKARMLSPTLFGRRAPIDPTRLRLAASVREFLNWNAARLQQFSPELPLELASTRQEWESGYRAAVVRFWPQSTIASPKQESLSLSGRRELDFRVTAETTWTAECRNMSSEETKFWLVLDYDRDQLELTGTNSLSVTTLEELRRDRNLDRLVDRLKLHSEPVTLPAGSTPQQIGLKFKIRSIAGKPSSVVLYAISERGNAMLKMVPRLPYSDLWSVGSTATASTLEIREGHNVLLPYPNRSTPFQFRLQYRGNRERTLDIDLFDLRAPLSSPENLTLHDHPTLLAQLSKLTISPLSPTLDLKFPMAGAPESGVSIRGPLAFRVTDLETFEEHWVPLFVETQRPRRYLAPSASYDAQEGKLSLLLKAIDLGLLPEGPIPVVCEIETIGDPASAVPLEPIKLEGELSREAPRLELLAVIPSKEGRVVSLKVHVDGFPRAFLFEIPCDASRDEIQELSGRAFTTISQPAPNQPFSTDVSRIDVKLKVDAPVGAFPDLSRTNHVALGLDLNGDGVQSPGESWLVLPSDRQSDLFLSGSKEGQLNLRTSVNDWSIRLPTGGIRNRRVSIQPLGGTSRRSGPWRSRLDSD